MRHVESGLGHWQFPPLPHLPPVTTVQSTAPEEVQNSPAPRGGTRFCTGAALRRLCDSSSSDWLMKCWAVTQIHSNIHSMMQRRPRMLIICGLDHPFKRLSRASSVKQTARLRSCLQRTGCFVGDGPGARITLLRSDPRRHRTRGSGTGSATGVRGGTV